MSSWGHTQSSSIVNGDFSIYRDTKMAVLLSPNIQTHISHEVLTKTHGLHKTG